MGLEPCFQARSCLQAMQQPCSSQVTAFALPQLLKEAVESQRMCELMKQQETHLKQQVRCYLVDEMGVTWAVCSASLLAWGLFPSSLRRKAPTWKVQGQECCWVWCW